MAKPTEIVKISDITKFGNRLAASIRANLRAVSKKLGGGGMVKLARATSRAGKTSISITIGEGRMDPNSPTQSIAGMIRAIEGGAKPHRIYPRTKKRLAFYWPKASPPFKRGPKLAGKLPDGRLSFFYVDHPGMTGFHPIEKSISATLGKATEELRQGVRANIIDALNISIREANRRRK